MSDNLINLFASCLQVLPETIDNNTSPDNTPQWDSLAAMDLVAVIEETYDCTLTTGEIMNMRTVGLVRKVLHKKGVKNILHGG